MEKGYPNTSSEFADEGTVAHYLGERCLLTRADAKEYIGAVVRIDGEGAYFSDGNGHEVDAEMADYVQTYVDTVLGYAASGGTLLVEKELPLTGITGEPDAVGTADAVVLHDDEIIIIDLKYGRGVEVEAEENDQLKIYALAALEQYAMLGDFTQCRLVISQPRVSRTPSEWVVLVDDLIAWRDFTVAPAAFNAMDFYENGGLITDDLNPSEKACRWCKAKADCPALADHVSKTIEAEFTDLSTECATTGEEIIYSLTPTAPLLLSQKMAAVDLIENWCKAIRAEVERQLLAGSEVSGYKLVQGRKGPRAWGDAVAAEELLKKMRLKKEEMYDFKLISPTTAEKVLKETPNRWNKVLPLITQSEGKPSVAPISDKRPVISFTPVESEFEAIE